MACPKCKSTINMIPKHISAADPRAKEYFDLCELYYHYALCKNAKVSTSELAGQSSLTANEMIEKSIEYCALALKLGHPEALWRMAYFYDKDYIGTEATDSVRYRTAAQLYLGLISCQDARFEGYENGEADEKTLLLKRRAADDLFSMLKGMSRRDRQIYAARLMEHGYLTQEAMKELSEQASKSGVEELTSVLGKATSRHRAPLFGIIRVQKDHLERIRNDILQFPAVKTRKIDLMFIPLNADDKYDFKNSIGGTSPFHVMRISSDEILRGCSMAIEKSVENCCVYFFNKAGKHKFYSAASKKAKLEKSISNDDIDKLISYTPGSSYVFYDDDMFHKNENIDKIIAEISANTEV